MDELYIHVKGGGEVCVPDSLTITTYVLIEQEDWFEKEIGFVRRLLRRGMRAVDIGANYGTYTLAMARAVGPDGRVWAYEPASATARYLRKTIERNDLCNVEPHQAALCDRTGDGRLQLHDRAELNRLGVDGAGEAVPLTSLDAEQALRDWGRIDFVKIDAEGAELDIVRGGERFFAEQSPLVMFERVAVDAANEGAQVAFREHGYELFKLIGPDHCLVPVGPDEPYDAFDLNLFACKPDRAAMLAAVGLLTAVSAPAPEASGRGLALWRAQPFTASFLDVKGALKPRYARALDAYAVWRDSNRPLAERCGALLAAADILRALTTETRNLAVLSTCARVAHEAAKRVLALDCIGRMLDIMNQRHPRLREPFWPPCERYDAMRPGADRVNWFAAATFEAHEERRAHSSQFAPPDTLARLEWLASSPYASPAMERRRQLTAIRAGRQRQRQPSPLLIKASAGHLNPQLWGGRLEPV
jgi:FkbM family methyltransferase